MYKLHKTPRFERDVKACVRRHWNTKALKKAISALATRDETPLDERLRDHQLKGSLAGHRALHVDSAPNPAKDTWVLMYEIDGDEIYLQRTGTHEEVYGK